MIGEGAFGRVYRGLDRRLGRAVAVKVIKPWWAEDSAWVERFEREAQMLARVNDPGIVQIFDIGNAAEGPYYVAELVAGESLAGRLRCGPLPVEQARDVAEQLCRALACAHRQGVMHCDVKPANVLLGAAGKVKVGDFGVARLAEGTSQAPSMTVAGTPRYMSPEQARGRTTTAATDVYSTGVVLYEMLAGKPPFVDGTAVELGLRHLQDPPPPLPSRVPPALRQIVERALAKDPAERYADCDAMAGALRDAAPAALREAGAAARSIAATRPTAPDPVGAPSPAAPGPAAALLGPTAAPSPAAAPGPAGAPGRAGATSSAAALSPVAAPSPAASRRSGRAVALAPRPATLERPSRPERATTPTRILVHAHETRPARNRRASDPSSGRRRALPLLAGLVLLAAGALAVRLITAQGATTTVPDLQRLPRGGVLARARRLHVEPVFSRRYSDAGTGIAIAQTPAAGARVSDGSAVRVTLSAGPPPVAVPGVVGEPAEAAENRLATAGLRYHVNEVPDPGTSAGVVTTQQPSSAVTVPHGSTVALSVAETPRWRPLTTFSGVDAGRSVDFRILGARWRVSYDMAFQGLCLLIVVCEGPSAEAVDLDTGSSSGDFELEEGQSQTHTFSSGPGLYNLVVSGGRDSARWSMTVEDYY